MGEGFIQANIDYVDEAVQKACRDIRWVSSMVTCCVLLTTGLGAALLWLFFYGIIFPMRQLVTDVRQFFRWHCCRRSTSSHGRVSHRGRLFA